VTRPAPRGHFSNSGREGAYPRGLLQGHYSKSAIPTGLFQRALFFMRPCPKRGFSKGRIPQGRLSSGGIVPVPAFPG
jgi:hypothetical protein